MTNNLFVNSVRDKGDLAGVFESDGEAEHFYLYKVIGQEGDKVLDSIPILTGNTQLTEEDISIRWDAAQERVGLFIHGQLCAVFNINNGKKYGGDYKEGGNPEIPSDETQGFYNRVYPK